MSIQSVFRGDTHNNVVGYNEPLFLIYYGYFCLQAKCNVSYRNKSYSSLKTLKLIFSATLNCGIPHLHNLYKFRSS